MKESRNSQRSEQVQVLEQAQPVKVFTQSQLDNEPDMFEDAKSTEDYSVTNVKMIQTSNDLLKIHQKLSGLVLNIK